MERCYAVESLLAKEMRAGNVVDRARGKSRNGLHAIAFALRKRQSCCQGRPQRDSRDTLPASTLENITMRRRDPTLDVEVRKACPVDEWLLGRHALRAPAPTDMGWGEARVANPPIPRTAMANSDTSGSRGGTHDGRYRHGGHGYVEVMGMVKDTIGMIGLSASRCPQAYRSINATGKSISVFGYIKFCSAEKVGERIGIALRSKTFRGSLAFAALYVRIV